MTTTDMLGALFVALAHLTTPLLYAIYKGHEVTLQIHFGPRRRRGR